MKRGVFLLILNFINEREEVKKSFFKRRKTLNSDLLNRYSINVNGKNTIVLELTESDLLREDVLSLLKIYKGRVLVSEKYKNLEILKDYLYDSKEYYKRAVLSSLINQIKTVNKDWKNLCIKTDTFSPFKELYELVRISKIVSIVTGNNAMTEKFIKSCYYEYGTIVNIKEHIPRQNNEIFLNLNEIDNYGKLMINVKGKEFLLYPDTRYFDNSIEYQKLLPFNIEYNIICSAFSDK